MVFQDAYEALNARHTVGRILREPLKSIDSSEAERDQWVLELLHQVGLPAEAINRYPHEFSGGQRQRIGIARAIALNPKLLVCDEPVSALDVSVQSQIMNLLMQQRQRGLAMLFIAHDLAVVKHSEPRDRRHVPGAHRRNCTDENAVRSTANTPTPRHFWMPFPPLIWIDPKRSSH